MNRPDLLTLLAIASGYIAPPPPYRNGEQVPDECAAHLMAHALALGHAVDAELAKAGAAADGHDHDCAPDSCAAGCPVALRDRRDELAPLEDRLLVAWRASGMPLGALVARAAAAYGVSGIMMTGGIGDRELCEHIDRYTRERQRPA